MKIVIAGAGEVGTHLAKMLSQENQDIVLMDPKEERLSTMSSTLELLPVVGNPTSLKDLEEVGIRKTDLFVSVTPEETTNIAACILAHSLGAHKTFARINNYEYLQPKNKELFEKLGINSMIYPEMLAAREIVTAVKRPWARQYVVAIKRKNETIIPRGNDHIESGDLLFFTTTRNYIEDVRLLAGKKNPEVKKVIIMGGSRIALRACQYLPNNIRVKVIEMNKEKSYRIAEAVPGNVLIINGDGRDMDLLMHEGIQDAQAFIALTENSSTNILACLAAKRFGVYRTVAKIENIDYIPLAESMDIGSVINKKLIAASHIYQFLLDADVSNVKCLTFANADVAELVARPDSKITKKIVRDLRLPRDMTLGGLIRNGKPMMIDGDTQIQAYDHVVVFCLDTAMRKLEDYFN